MTATNHFLTGAFIATVINEPILALPVALGSHFALDLLPHFGVPEWPERQRYRSLFELIWRIDAIALICALVYVSIISNTVWPVIGGIVAFSPDFAWIYRYTVKEKWGKLPPSPRNWVNRIHAGLQWGEFVGGWRIEIAWCLMMTALLWVVEK